MPPKAARKPRAKKKKGRAKAEPPAAPYLDFEPDKMALIVASVLTTIVLASCFFWRRTDFPTTVWRAGITLTVSYATTFGLVLIIKRISGRELEDTDAGDDEMEDDEAVVDADEQPPESDVDVPPAQP